MGIDNVYGTGSLRPGVCTSTSRPGSPYDGMMIYETDTNLTRVWNGSAWKTLSYSDYTNGSVLQVAQTLKTDTFTSAGMAQGGEADITGLSVTITPTSSSSKIFVVANVYGAGLATSTSYNPTFAFRIYRGSTNIGQGDAASNRSRVAGQVGHIATLNQNLSGLSNATAFVLDSPATTSATTYKITAVNANFVADTVTMYCNFASFYDTDAARTPRAASSITVMEIAA